MKPMAVAAAAMLVALLLPAGARDAEWEEAMLREEQLEDVGRAVEHVQTVDDLVFNHFLLHSLQSRGWWWGDQLKRRKSDKKRREANRTCTTRWGVWNCSDSEVEPLWRQRYRLRRRIDDGSRREFQIREAEDARASDAVRFIHFYERQEDREEDLRFVHEFNVYVPEHAMEIVEVFETAEQELPYAHGRYISVLEGGQPLSEVMGHDGDDLVDLRRASSLLREVETSLQLLSRLNLEVGRLSFGTIFFDSQRILFHPAISQVLRLSGKETFLGNIDDLPALCKPEKSERVRGAEHVWAYRNIVYLMAPRPGFALEDCTAGQRDEFQQ